MSGNSDLKTPSQFLVYFPSPFGVSDPETSSFGLQVFALANHKVLESIAFVWQLIHKQRGARRGGGAGSLLLETHTRWGASFSTQRFRLTHPPHFRVQEKGKVPGHQTPHSVHVSSVMSMRIWAYYPPQPTSKSRPELGSIYLPQDCQERF